MARTFWGDHHHIDLSGWDDLAIMDIKSMREQEGFPLLKIGLDVHFIESGLDMILGEDLNQIGLFGCLRSGDWLEALFEGKTIIFSSPPFCNDHAPPPLPQG